MSDSLKQQLAIEDAAEGRVIPGWRASLISLTILATIIAARIIPQRPEDLVGSAIVIGVLWSISTMFALGLLDRFRRRWIG